MGLIREKLQQKCAPQYYDTTASSRSHQRCEGVVPELQHIPLHHWGPKRSHDHWPQAQIAHQIIRSTYINIVSIDIVRVLYPYN